MNRVTHISVTEVGSVANYAYTGASRRVWALLGGVILQSVAAASGSGYDGLDRFGRLRDLHYQTGSSGGPTLHRYQYDYDKAGNRTYALVQQADWQGQPHVNDRSWLYKYDRRQRLIGGQMGTLTFTPEGPMVQPSAQVPIPTETTWELDNLGNWSGDGDPATPGPQSVITVGQLDGQGGADTSILHHEVDSANELLEVVRNGLSTPILTDPAGNLTRDIPSGTTYVYQYDGLNRLVQVNEKGVAQLDPQGRIITGPLGSLIFRYVYDGVGRVIRKELRESDGISQLRIEKYYYDGVRRIQDVITRPLASAQPPPCEPEPVSKEGAESEWKDAEGQPQGTELEPCKKGDPEESATSVASETWTDREYVYGPGDVNEFILQIDAQGNPIYMLQDGNLNVVGLVTVDPSDGSVDVRRQDVYTPYGELTATDLDPTLADNKVGFQGMFFDRFTTAAADPQLVPGGIGVCRAANRVYRPDLGRWMQRDPNATAQLIVEALAFNGQALTILRAAFDLEAHYGDGMNGYEFVRSNPINNTDALGLVSFLDILITGVDHAVRRAGNAAVVLAARGAFTSVAAALALRNQILTAISNTALRLGTQRGGDYAARAYSVLNQTADKVFTVNTYRRGYEWLMGQLQQGTRVHHIFPQEFVKFFRGKGINIHLPTWLTEIETHFHSQYSYAYNAAWRAWITAHKNATVDEIFDFARRAMQEVFKLPAPF
jgi:hypothetical protein